MATYIWEHFNFVIPKYLVFIIFQDNYKLNRNPEKASLHREISEKPQQSIIRSEFQGLLGFRRATFFKLLHAIVSVFP